MISESGRSKRVARASSSLERRGEVARVEEARLRVDARLLLEHRDRERAVDEEERRERDRDEPRVACQMRRDRKPSGASTSSLERLSKLKRPPVARIVCPRPKLSITASTTWFIADEDDAPPRRRRHPAGTAVPDRSRRGRHARAPRREEVDV